MSVVIFVSPPLTSDWECERNLLFLHRSDFNQLHEELSILKLGVFYPFRIPNRSTKFPRNAKRRNSWICRKCRKSSHKVNIGNVLASNILSQFKTLIHLSLQRSRRTFRRRKLTTPNPSPSESFSTRRKAFAIREKPKKTSRYVMDDCPLTILDP